MYVDEEEPFFEADSKDELSGLLLKDVVVVGSAFEDVPAPVEEEEAPGKSLSCSCRVFGAVPVPERSDEMWFRNSVPLHPAVRLDSSWSLSFDLH